MRIAFKRFASYFLWTIPFLGYVTLVYLLNYESCSAVNNNNMNTQTHFPHEPQGQRFSIPDPNLGKLGEFSSNDLKIFKGINSNSRNIKTFSIRINPDVNAPEDGASSEVRNPEDNLVFYQNGNTKEFVKMVEGVRNPYYYDCSNIHLIRLRKKVGEGVSKQTYLGEFNGHQVAVKMVTRHQADVRKCLVELKQTLTESGRLSPGADPSQAEKAKCYVFPTMKLMKETLILQQLNHPSIVKLLGFCVRSEESEASDLSEHGVIVIEEYGSRFMLSALQILPWQKRLKHARDLASLLYYLEHSPLGSLKVPDFKEPHFLMKNDTIKLTDFDDVSNLEPPCSSHVRTRDNLPNLTKSRSPCEFDLPCQMAMCVGRNAKINLKNTRKLFFKRLLLPGSFPEEIADDITEINVKLDNLSIDAQELYSHLTHLLETPIEEDVDQ